MDTRRKIIQRLRYVPTVLWVILAFLIVLGAAAYVTQDDTDIAQDQEQTEVATENGQANGDETEATGGVADGEVDGQTEGDSTATTDGEGDTAAEDEELPNELVATGPAESAAVMIAVTSTLGAIYLGSRKRIEAKSRN